MAAVVTFRSGPAAVHPASSRRPPRWDPLSWVAAPPRRPGVRVCECVGAGCVWPEVPGASGQLSSAPEQWSPAGRAWPGATIPVAGVAGGAGRAPTPPQRPVWRAARPARPMRAGGAVFPEALGTDRSDSGRSQRPSRPGKKLFLVRGWGLASGSGG